MSTSLCVVLSLSTLRSHEEIKAVSKPFEVVLPLVYFLEKRREVDIESTVGPFPRN